MKKYSKPPTNQPDVVPMVVAFFVRFHPNLWLLILHAFSMLLREDCAYVGLAFSAPVLDTPPGGSESV